LINDDLIVGVGLVNFDNAIEVQKIIQIRK